jgi:hypothetical protein
MLANILFRAFLSSRLFCKHLSVVLDGCETVSHAKGEYRLRVFENGVLRRIFGSKRNEEAGA